MRAVVCSELAPVEGLSIGEMPDPVPGPGELVIDVQAAALNFFEHNYLFASAFINPNATNRHLNKHRV